MLRAQPLLRCRQTLLAKLSVGDRAPRGCNHAPTSTPDPGPARSPAPAPAQCRQAPARPRQGAPRHQPAQALTAAKAQQSWRRDPARSSPAPPRVGDVTLHLFDARQQPRPGPNWTAAERRAVADEPVRQPRRRRSERIAPRPFARRCPKNRERSPPQLAPPAPEHPDQTCQRPMEHARPARRNRQCSRARAPAPRPSAEPAHARKASPAGRGGRSRPETAPSEGPAANIRKLPRCSAPRRRLPHPAALSSAVRRRETRQPSGIGSTLRPVVERPRRARLGARPDQGEDCQHRSASRTGWK